MSLVCSFLLVSHSFARSLSLSASLGFVTVWVSEIKDANMSYPSLVLQKAADKSAKAKKGGKAKKEDKPEEEPAENGETKTEEVGRDTLASLQTITAWVPSPDP